MHFMHSEREEKQMQKYLSKITLVVLVIFVIGTTIPFNASAASLETTGAVKTSIHMRKPCSCQGHQLF